MVAMGSLQWEVRHRFLRAAQHSIMAATLPCTGHRCPEPVLPLIRQDTLCVTLQQPRPRWAAYAPVN